MHWMYGWNDDDETLYDSLTEKKEDVKPKDEEEDNTKWSWIRCFKCGVEDWAKFDKYGRYMCPACKQWEKDHL